jgi:hypothetical protein
MGRQKEINYPLSITEKIDQKRKVSRALGICETIIKHLTFVLMKSGKERRRGWDGKGTQVICKFSKFDKL